MLVFATRIVGPENVVSYISRHIPQLAVRTLLTAWEDTARHMQLITTVVDYPHGRIFLEPHHSMHAHWPAYALVVKALQPGWEPSGGLPVLVEAAQGCGADMCTELRPDEDIFARLPSLRREFY